MEVTLIFSNETYKRFIIIWDYKFDFLMQLLMVALIFLGASFFLGNGQFNSSQLPTMLLGYTVWFYARIVIMDTSGDLMAEAQAGTLEQLYMSTVSTSLLLLGRMFAMLISTTVVLILPVSFLLILLHVYIPLRVEELPVLLLTLAGLFGFSLILCGATLVFKQIHALADLIQNVLLFMAGTLVPLSSFPDWLAKIARTLPLTQGIAVLREVTFGGETLADTWANGSLFWLTIHSLVYMIVGWIIFKLSERFAMQQGSLGQY